MQVHCDEGVAIHIGPEPCVVVCKDGGEASVGERIGQPLSRERNLIPGADAVVRTEGNLVEGFFSKLARSVLRHIRISSKQELKERLMAAIDYFNDDPVVHTWTYKLDKAA